MEHARETTPSMRVRATRTSADTPIHVLDKAGALLDVLTSEGPQTVAQLAGAVGEPRSSVYRILNSLNILGWVEVDTGGVYRVGMKLFRIGQSAVAGLDVRVASLPVMKRMHRETGETVYLCIRRGFEAVCIERLDGRRVQSLALTIGGSLPLHVGAAPRVLLAYADSDLKHAWVDALGERELERYTPRTPVDLDTIERLLREVRTRGVSISDEDVTPGIAGIGAPVFDHAGVCVAALSMSGIRSGVIGPDRDLTSIVIAGAAEVSRVLGYSPANQTGDTDQ